MNFVYALVFVMSPGVTLPIDSTVRLVTETEEQCVEHLKTIKNHKPKAFSWNETKYGEKFLAGKTPDKTVMFMYCVPHPPERLLVE